LTGKEIACSLTHVAVQLEKKAMSTIAAKREITPAELLARPDAADFELVDGELLERNVSVLSSQVEGIVHNKLFNFSREKDCGEVWPSSNGYQCFPDAPKKVRRPDVSFVRRERFSPEYFREGFLTIHPDLAVEVVSPNDTAYEVDEKVEEYLAAGVSLVWVVNPETRIVEVHRKDRTVTKLYENDELSGEDILPGFHCQVASLFPAIEATTK
jgi:Uma2 family endonuclease